MIELLTARRIQIRFMMKRTHTATPGIGDIQGGVGSASQRTFRKINPT